MRTYRFKINEATTKTLNIGFTPPAGTLAARCVATNSSGNSTTLAGAVVINGSNLEVTIPNTYATYGNFPAKFEIQLQVNGGAWYTEVEAYGGLVSAPVETTSSLTNTKALIKSKTDRVNKIRNLGGYQAPAAKCPLTKATVSVTLNAFDVTGAAVNVPYKITDLQNIAECNWKPAHVSQYVVPNYNYYSIFTGPWSPGDTSPIYSPLGGKLVKPMDITTIVEGSYFSIGGTYVAGAWIPDVRIWIDGEEIVDWYLGTRAGGTLQGKSTITATSLGTGNHIININFAKRGTYKVRVHGLLTTFGGAAQNTSTAGNIISTQADARLLKPAARANIGLICDSWAEAITQNTSLSLAGELTHQLNANIWNFAQGGSGFVNPSGGGVNGDRSYKSNLVWDAVNRGPALDMLIINGSANDMAYTDQQVLDAMQVTFDRARAYRSDIPIVWVGVEPQSYFEGIYTAATMKARETLQLNKALADPNVVAAIACANEDWLTGTGRVGATAGNGNQDFVTGTDAIHLSAYGTEFIGKMIAERVKAAVLNVNV